MKLCELLKDIAVLVMTADPEMEISGVCYDSRNIEAGDLFVAITGWETDGHRFIHVAKRKGAACVIAEERPEVEIPYVLVEDSRAALAQLGCRWYGNPAQSMNIIAVTGTNGKTTTTYLLKDILEKTRGAKVGLIGTDQNMIGDAVFPTERTTPESFELHGLFRRMADEGCTHVVMEVSSHALYLKRVAGVRFAVGIFTNLTQDHLDFHETMEAYCDAKALLFRQCDTGVYNADDPWAGRVTENAACPLVSVGCGTADLAAENIALGEKGISFDAVTADERVSVNVGIPGGFMVYNVLGALAAARAVGIPLSESAEALRTAERVKGRVEVVPTGTDYTVLIDYAHSPDALENLLKTVRGFAGGRVFILFGCGGRRDKTKRPIMGRIAAELADAVIVTTDNPRTEDARDIIADIVEGMIGTETPYVVVEDRREAIRFAMDNAGQGDVVVLAGKGHETYQIVGTQKIPFDEREVIAAYLAEKKKD